MAMITCERCGNQFSSMFGSCPKCGADAVVDFSDGAPLYVPGAGDDARYEKTLDRELTLQFNGSAREYFRVWAVNLCLSLLTVGLFSAWAKVRRKRYFYSSTTLDGTPFQYVGQPWPILRGRIAAATLFGLYYASTHFVISLLPYVLAIAAVLAPWVLVCSAAFNARYSAFRNMTFRFDGSYWDVLRQLHGWGLFPAVVIGTAFEWFGHLEWAGLLYIAAAIAFPFWQRRFKRFIVDHTSFGGRNAQLQAQGRDFLRAYITGGLIGAGLILLLIPISAAIWMAGLRQADGALTIGIVFVVFFYATYVFVSACIQARISNLVWNSTRLGPLWFHSSLTGRGLGKLYLTNTLAIIGSLGFLIPWAAVRTTNYRLTELRVFLDGEVGEFHGEPADTVPAVGAELGGFFDIDLSL